MSQNPNVGNLYRAATILRALGERMQGGENIPGLKIRRLADEVELNATDLGNLLKQLGWKLKGDPIDICGECGGEKYPDANYCICGQERETPAADESDRG